MRIVTVLLFHITLFTQTYGSSTTTINGLPSHVAVGDTIQVFASGADAPYTWVSSNPAAVQVIQVDTIRARVIVLASSPAVTISATDEVLVTGTQIISSHDFSARIPDVSFIHRDTVELPVYYTDRSPALDLYSADIFLPYDTTVFTFIGVNQAGTLSAGMTVFTNQVFDTIKMAIAVANPIVSADSAVFIKLKFISKDTVITPITRPMHFTKFLVNEVLDGVITDGSLTVNPIPNYPPVISVNYPDTVFIAESQYFSHVFTASDPNGDSVRFHLLGMPAGMVIDSVSGLLEWTPDFLQSGIYIPKIMASDTLGGVDIDSLVFVVSNTNRPPVFSVLPDTFYLKETMPFFFTLTAVDPDLEPLIFRSGPKPAGMMLDSVTGFLSWTPGFNDSGSHTVNFSVHDPYDSTNSYTPVFFVLDSNRVPILTAVPSDTTILEGETYLSLFTASDPDSGDLLHYYVFSGAPPGFLLDSVTGAISWTPNNSQQGVYTIVLVVSDFKPYGTVKDSFTVTVSNVNLPPVITTGIPDTLYMPEGQLFTLDIDATDGDGDSLKYSIVFPPPGMVIDSLTGVVQWTPDYSQAGEYNPTFKVLDSLGGYATKYVVLFVLNVDRPPVFTSNVPDTTINEGQLLTLQFTASDPDLDSLTFVLLTPKPGINLTPAGLLQWQPSFSQAGVETLFVMVTDGMIPAVDTVVVTILNVNNPPAFSVVLPDTAIARFDTLRFQYTAIDAEGDGIVYSLLNFPAGATMTTAGLLEWAPLPGSAGKFTVVVQAMDSVAAVTDTAVVNVIRFGDVSLNGSISSFDAALILRDQAEAISLTPLQRKLGNVSGDTSISALDASYILQFVVSLIDTFPGGLGKRSLVEAVPSAFTFKIVPTSNTNEYDLIVSATKPSNVFGITMSLGYDTTLVTPLTLKPGALTDSMISAVFFPKGKANLALAGTKPLNAAGEIARLTFKIQQQQNLSGNVVLFTMIRFVLNERDFAGDIAGITLNIRETAGMPTVYALGQNFPNPFNPVTTISYQLPQESNVIVTVYNLLGQEVKMLVHSTQPPGYYNVTWNGIDDNHKPVSSGVYLYKIVAQAQGKSEFISTKKMLFLK